MEFKQQGKGRGSLTAMLVLGTLAGAALVVVPFFIGERVPQTSKLMISGFGGVVALVFSLMVIITRLYRKTSADQAFVRTGVGGRKCVIDGGAIVVPVVHEVIDVSLKTFKIEVERTGPDALITGDYLRADVVANFFCRVQKDPESVMLAATSLGSISNDPAAVRELVMEKLVSVLRNVAATQTLEDLNAKRAEFARGVQESVKDDLKANGLTLESVTISKLDQAPLTAMKPEQNVFDAQGAATITKQVQAQRVLRNEMVQAAELKVTQQNVTTAQQVAAQQVLESRAKADAEAEKSIALAASQQRAASFAAEQDRLAGIARVESEQAVKLRQVDQDKAVEVANQERERAAQVARIERERAAELSVQEKMIAVADAERRRAEKEAEQLLAERDRKSAEQAVVTVEVRATAEREKERAIIGKQATVEQVRIEQQMQAEVEAYKNVKEAEGQQLAASKQAEARIALADAERRASELRAEGDRAIQMVPVGVAQEQVKVADAQVTVQIRELEGKARFERIALDLQVELAKIEAEKQARIAAAEAAGKAMAASQMTIYGDPLTAQRMMASMVQGQSLGAFLGGVNDTIPPEIRSVGGAGGAALGLAVAALVKKLTGIDVDPANVEAAASGSAAGSATDDRRSAQS
ncbi:MAG: SPFH domain-containing protein [Phycisphaerales bacterium]